MKEMLDFRSQLPLIQDSEARIFPQDDGTAWKLLVGVPMETAHQYVELTRKIGRSLDGVYGEIPSTFGNYRFLWRITGILDLQETFEGGALLVPFINGPQLEEIIRSPERFQGQVDNELLQIAVNDKNAIYSYLTQFSRSLRPLVHSPYPLFTTINIKHPASGILEATAVVSEVRLMVPTTFNKNYFVSSQFVE